jgi:hypothetical protein
VGPCPGRLDRRPACRGCGVQMNTDATSHSRIMVATFVNG